MDTGWLSQAAADFLVRHGSAERPVFAQVVDVPSGPPLPGMDDAAVGLGPGVWVFLCSWDRSCVRVRCRDEGRFRFGESEVCGLSVPGLVAVLPREGRDEVLGLHRLVPLPMLWCFDLVLAGRVEAARFLVEGLGGGGVRRHDGWVDHRGRCRDDPCGVESEQHGAVSGVVPVRVRRVLVDSG
jgi:hypothetical protein